MQPISTLVTVLCGLALSVGPAHATRIVYSCNVVQNLSGVSHPETVALDDDTQVVSHLKHSWSEGGHPLFANGLTQFVEVSKERLTWGNRRKLDQVITDLFSVNLTSGRYAWMDTDGTEIAHGSCKLPATS